MGRNVEHRCNKNVKVFFRILPLRKMNWEHVKILDDKKTAYVRNLQRLGDKDVIPSYWKFETDGIFYNRNQEEVYQTVVADGVLESVIEGSNAIILAYGQTGTGKSLTIGGLQNSYQDRGIAPRVIADLFQLKQEYKDKYNICLQMSYIETTRSHVLDLLNTKDKDESATIRNFKIVKVKNIYSALKTLFKAEGRRQMTRDSHKANGLLTIHVITRLINLATPEFKVSKLHLVDLAGVDIYGNPTSFYKTIFDIGGANTAKSQLEQFMLILCQNNPIQVHVKQRLNPIIQYLGDSLNGRSILRYIGHIRIDLENLIVTTSMFRFGQIVRGLKPLKLQNNVAEDKEVKFKIIEEQLKQSAIEKDLEVMMANHDLSANLTQERIKHMQNVVQEYLHNKTNEIVLLNVTDATTVLQVFKTLYNQLENERNECLKAAFEKSAEDYRGSKAVLLPNEGGIASKGSRRGSKSMKSKESLQGSKTAAQTKSQRRSDRASVSSTQSRARSIDKTKMDSPKASIRRSRTSSIIKKTGTRRRSAQSTSSVGTEANDQLLEESISTEVPNNQEAWNKFIEDSDYQYSILANNLNACETIALESRTAYLEEVKILQKLFDIVDLRKNELQKAQMQRLLNKEERDAEGHIVISQTEKHCLDNVDKAHEELVAQQEKVLKQQALYRINIERYLNTKKEINDQFQLFCQDKYHIPLPDTNIMPQPLYQISQEEHLIATICLEGRSVDPIKAQVSQEALHYEKLKELMKKQIAKTLRKNETNKKWVQSCKV